MLGHYDSQNRTRKGWAVLLGLVVFSLLLAGCGAKPKTYTIGVARETSILEAALNEFKAGMTESGYVEGKNVTYIDHGLLGAEPQKNEAEIKSFVDQKVDLILALGTAPAIAAKKGVEGTAIPVVFVPVTNPVGEGLVASISHPGGNLTGIQAIISSPKALEWLLKLAPGTKRVYIPYNPADAVSVTTIKPLPEVAAQLGVELVPGEVKSGEEELAAIKALPKDAAILFVTSPSLNPSLENASELAAELGIPAGENMPMAPDKTLFTYTMDPAQAGKQAVMLVDKVLRGTKPTDLPVETVEYSLTINLKTAQAIGLHIPDGILRQAQNVIR